MFRLNRDRREDLATARALAGLGILGLIALGSAARAGTPPAGFAETTVVSTHPITGAEQPTAAAYDPETGDLWVLEKGDGASQGTARVRVRDAISGVVSTALTLDCVDSRGERGLLGIAFAPDFVTSRHVFLFYTRRIAATGTCSQAGEAEASRNRVSRFTETSRALSSEVVILDGEDLLGATNHNGGTLRFAPDGTLFISTGDNDTDAAANPLSRDLGDLRGKLLRINADGSIPADNPFVGQLGIRPEIWAWGLRNPFRFGIDSETAAPIIADVGELQWEAVYQGIAGADYGYPCFEGSAPFRLCNPAPPPGTVTHPIFEYGHDNQTPPVSGNSITGGPVYRHDAFPEEYRGAYFFGDFVDGWIRRAHFGPTGALTDVELFMPDAFSVVDMVVSPDGCLTWVSIGSGVREVCYSGGTNSQPQAVSTADPTAGLANLNVQFSGSQSSDPDFHPLLYDWDFDDGSSSILADPSHLFTSNGVFQVTLDVDDQQGEVNSVDSAPPLRIVVGNRAPSPTIASPGDGTLYGGGDTISFSGGATDPEEGVLGADRLSWTVVFHHDIHTHPFLGPINGVSSGQFVIPATGEDSTNVFYRLHLTATDTGVPLGAGAELAATTTIDLVPNVSRLTVAAHPPGFGIELEIDHQLVTAPAFLDSVAGFERTLGAPSPQTTGGWTFFFQSWSDGGAAEHTVTTPGVDTIYTATFAIACSSPDEVELANEMVITEVSVDACVSITAGPSYTIGAGGDVTLTAGETIALDNGFSVESGGTLAAIIIPRI